MNMFNIPYVYNYIIYTYSPTMATLRGVWLAKCLKHHSHMLVMILIVW